MDNGFQHYIGLPYHAEENNCWGFFRLVQQEKFQRILPEFPIDTNDLRCIIRTFAQAEERKKWPKVAQPSAGDAVLLRRAKNPIHIGIWLDIDGGGILHCLEHVGVVFQNPQHLILHGWHINGYYRFSPSQKECGS